MRAMRDAILRDIDAWRAAKRAAASDDYAPHTAGYLRRAEAYRLTIATNIRGAMR
jgi:hypothetical protein